MNSNTLTNKQLMILEFIKEQLLSKGYPPSVREICQAVGLKSTSTVHSHLNKLEKLGYIRRDPTKPRAIEILDGGNVFVNNNNTMQEMINLPLVGQVTAGEPILAQQNIQEYIPLPAQLIKGNDSRNKFFDRIIDGESMINAGILNNDYVVVDKGSTASNSQIVVALVNKESATVKRFFKEGSTVRLQPENEFMEPIILNERDVEIVGTVTGVFRVL